MAVKIVCAFVAVILFFGYLGTFAWKLKSAALLAVMAIGSILMLYDLWQSLREE